MHGASKIQAVSLILQYSLLASISYFSRQSCLLAKLLKLRLVRVFTDLAWVASHIESGGPNVKVAASDYGDSRP
jgi:hypothetical protein